MDAPPPGYTEPVVVCLVEETNEAGETRQVGGFFSVEEATTLLWRVLRQGRDAHLNYVAIHHRVVDWEWDR
jgi:hypothetical protein